MAKKVRSKGLVRAKKTKLKKAKKKKAIINYNFLILALVLLFIVFLGFIKVLSKNEIKTIKISAKIPLKQKIKPQSLITPYPTIKMTPTLVPLVGFCLRVPILTYHHIQPESAAKELGQTSLTVDNGIFDSQMAYLIAGGYTPVFANELINALVTHTAIPGKPIMVTMDDGYADNYNYALPVLKKYNIKANLMLASGLVGSNSDMLTWDQIREMKSSGLIYFTNHTWSHYAIANGPQTKIETEIDTAQAQIQQYTGQAVNIFTYPYGSFNNNAVQTLQKKGYIGGFTTIPGTYQCDSFIMTLHRSHIGNAPLSAYGI